MMEEKKKKIIRACTVSQSIGFVKGMLPDLMKKYEVVILSSPGPEMDAVREQYGVKTIALPMERHISVRHDIVSLWKMVKVMLREKPDMVHSMTPKAGLLCMMAGWLTRVPLRVHTFTGLVFPTATGLKRRILMLTDSITCFCATHVIPEGEGVKADLQNNGITKKPLKVLGYGNVKGIDMQRFSRRPEVMAISRQIPTSGATFTFLFVGRIVRDKGINELAKAFQQLSKKHPEARLLLVGNYEETLDPVSDETRQIIEDMPNLEWLGPKRGDELIAYYAASDCFVFPSYREGFPNTVIEAGAMGLPSIVTDINGSREIVCRAAVDADLKSASRESRISDTLRPGQDGKMSILTNGIMVPSKDVETLQEAMERMLTDKAMHQEMARNARPMIEQRFEQGFVRSCLYDFYKTILPAQS